MNLNVEHALTCPTGGLATLRHNGIRDLTADLMAEVCNVCTESELQPLSGEDLQGRFVALKYLYSFLPQNSKRNCL